MEARELARLGMGRRMLNRIRKITRLGKKKLDKEEPLVEKRANAPLSGHPALAAMAFVLAGAFVSACYQMGPVPKNEDNDRDSAGQVDTEGPDTNSGTGIGGDADSDVDSDTKLDTDSESSEKCGEEDECREDSECETWEGCYACVCTLGEGMCYDDSDCDEEQYCYEHECTDEPVCVEFEYLGAYFEGEYPVVHYRAGIEYTEQVYLSDGLEDTYWGEGHPEVGAFSAVYIFDAYDDGIPEYLGNPNNPSHRISAEIVNFIYDGEEFVITGLGGGELEFAKEEVGGLIHTGDIIWTWSGGEEYGLHLTDIENMGNWGNAVISVVDSEGFEVCTERSEPGETRIAMCGIEGLDVHVYQSATGLNFIAKWAELAVLNEVVSIGERSGDNLEGEYAYFGNINGVSYLQWITVMYPECVKWE